MASLYVVLGGSCQGSGNAWTESDMGAYLMAYHKDEDHGLHLAVSLDGYHFTALRGDRPFIAGDTIAMQKGIRDPHLFRAPDGCFYLAMTDLHIYAREKGYRQTEFERDKEAYGWGNNKGIVLMKSADLKHWSRSNIDLTLLGGKWKDVGCVWAPETCYDDKAGKLMVHFTVRFGNGLNSIYYAYADNDFTSLIGEPKPLHGALEKGYSVIDSDIVKAGGKYHLFYVSHENGACIQHAVSDSINGGYVNDTCYYDGESLGREAPSCWKRNGRYYLLYSSWTRGYEIGYATAPAITGPWTKGAANPIYGA
ncbi:MAG: glycoside hydrolase family 43 protein [Bacteroides sp.]|nr:glycoside hydrolase family 43 protein [Bacteroides sp.]